MKKYFITAIVIVLMAVVAYLMFLKPQATTISQEGYITTLEGEILSSPGNSSLER